MKVVILAGGRGTRLAEETSLRPKPMVKIGSKPILWHIMKIYSSFGMREFVICCGYKGYMIKEYFANYFLHNSDVSFDMSTNDMQVHQAAAEPWRVTLVDTGDEVGTGGRLRRVRDYLGDEDFCFTYGDGVADVDIDSLVRFHRQQGRLATITTIQPPSKYGVLSFDGDRLTGFQEKPQEREGGWINGGFFVLSPKVIDYIEGDPTHWEHAPMQQLVAAGEVSAYFHHGFWQSMDTLREKELLQGLWQAGKAPWKLW